MGLFTHSQRGRNDKIKHKARTADKTEGKQVIRRRFVDPAAAAMGSNHDLSPPIHFKRGKVSAKHSLVGVDQW